MISILLDNRSTNMVPALPTFARETDGPDISGNIEAECSECITSETESGLS